MILTILWDCEYILMTPGTTADYIRSLARKHTDSDSRWVPAEYTYKTREDLPYLAPCRNQYLNQNPSYLPAMRCSHSS
jgi:hypothetical protein